MTNIRRVFVLFLAMVIAFSTLLPACAQEAERDELWETVEEAYIYSYPLVLMSYTAQTLPKNQLVHARKLATPENKSVVTMNVDTLYSQIMMDLQDAPMILVFPECDRYMQMQVMDAWSNTVAVIGEAGVYAFVRTGSDADLPADMKRIEIPTRLSWCIGRTLLRGNDDLSNVIALQDAMDFRTLHSYLSGEDDSQDANAQERIRKDVVPVKAVMALTGQEFFDCANRLMADNPPAAADGEIVERISKLGVGPGMQFDASILNDDAEAYLITGDFELKSDEDFVVVYGVNHAYTGKAHYFNAVMHERPMVNGVCSIYDSLLPGSADEYIGEHRDEAEGYYVYKMARTQMDEHTAIIPYATGNKDGRYYGVDNGSPVFVIFRIYLDETGVGADCYELVYDRVIVFHKKAQ